MSVITDAPANIIIPFSGSPFFAGALPMTQRATNNTNYFDSLRVAKNNDSQPKKFCLKNSRSSSVFWAGIKETDKVRAPKRDLWRLQNNAFLLVASKRNIRKHLNMEIFGNLQVNDEQRRIARKFSIIHVRPVNVWMKTFVKYRFLSSKCTRDDHTQACSPAVLFEHPSLYQHFFLQTKPSPIRFFYFHC